MPTLNVNDSIFDRLFVPIADRSALPLTALTLSAGGGGMERLRDRGTNIAK